MPYTKLGNVNIPVYYELHGTESEDRPLVIFVNAWSSSSRYWSDIVKKLSTDYQILVYDTRGVGRSQNKDREVPENYHATIDSSVRELEELIEAVGLGNKAQIEVIGHSLGTVIASRFAARLEAVGKLAGLTLVNCGSFENFEQVGDKLIPVLNIFIRIKSLFGLPLIRGSVISRMTAMPIEDKFKQVIVQDIIQSNQRLSLEVSVSSLSKRNLVLYEKELKALKAPLLLIVGDKDATIPPKGMYNIKQFKPESNLVAFPKCGHFPMLEQPDKFASVLASHFATAGSKGVANLEPNNT